MALSDKVLDAVNSSQEIISCEELTTKTTTNIFFTKAAAKALREEKKIRLVAQTKNDETPHRGVLSGGDLYETTQWYEKI
jgi:hypothetical protein